MPGLLVSMKDLATRKMLRCSPDIVKEMNYPQQLEYSLR